MFSKPPTSELVHVRILLSKVAVDLLCAFIEELLYLSDRAQSRLKAVVERREIAMWLHVCLMRFALYVCELASICEGQGPLPYLYQRSCQSFGRHFAEVYCARLADRGSSHLNAMQCGCSEWSRARVCALVLSSLAFRPAPRVKTW